jgi:hypothetical protein
MPNGRPGDSRTHDIVHHRLTVFGPSCDGLVREIMDRLPRERLNEFHELVETWPFEPDGRPRDGDALFARLLAFRDSVARPPGETLRRLLRALLAALLGFLVGGVAIGLGPGVLALVIGALTGASQFEGAFAMGVAAMMPVAGLLGGAVVALWLGWRSWRRSRSRERD